DGSDGTESPDTVAAERGRFVDQIRAIRREMALVQSSVQNRGGQAGGLDQAWLALLRARAEEVWAWFVGMVRRSDAASGADVRWLRARGLDVALLVGDVASLLGAGEDVVSGI